MLAVTGGGFELDRWQDYRADNMDHGVGRKNIGSLDCGTVDLGALGQCSGHISIAGNLTVWPKASNSCKSHPLKKTTTTPDSAGGGQSALTPSPTAARLHSHVHAVHCVAREFLFKQANATGNTRLLTFRVRSCSGCPLG